MKCDICNEDNYIVAVQVRGGEFIRICWKCFYKDPDHIEENEKEEING